MIRTVAPLVIGMIAGAAVMALNFGPSDAESSARTGQRSVFEAVTRLAGGSGRSGVAGNVSVSDRLSAYRQADRESDLARLRRALEAAASRGPSLERDLDIDATLGRLSALSPAFAADLALALGLERRFVVDAFVLWANAGPEAALAGLGRIADAPIRREVGLGLLDALGGGIDARDRVAQALPASDRDALTVASLSRRVVVDPLGAMREAQSLSDATLQREALAEIAAIWAAEDPGAALLQAELLPADLARTFRAAVYNEWARLDSGAYAAHLESLTTIPEEVASGMQFLIVSDPERALEVADGIPGSIGESMRSMAIGAIAAQDPGAAMARIDAMPPGQLKERFLTSVAYALARKDPDAAIAWAEGLDPPVPNVIRNVASALAQTDLARALDLLEQPSLAGESSLVLAVVNSEVRRNPDKAREVASLLVARDDAESATALQGVVASWMQLDPESALGWVLGNDALLNNDLLTSAAQTLARDDPAGAAAFVDRLPQRYRSAWVTQVAGQYARFDPATALAWVSRFQGQDYYNIALREVVANAAQTDPRAAARALTQATSEAQLGAASQVATAWARTEPQEAARWASGLSEPRARTLATNGAITTWARSDAAGARSWSLSLPSGETRDQAISSVANLGAMAGAAFDPALIDEIEDLALRQQTIGNGLTVLARQDPDRAESLLEAQSLDAVNRQLVENAILQGREAAANGSSPSNSILILR